MNFRKDSKAIHDGKTIHFSPVKGVYFLFRILNDEIVVHIINKNETPVNIELKRFEEVGLQGETLKNIITGEQITWGESLRLVKKGSLLLTKKNNLK